MSVTWNTAYLFTYIFNFLATRLEQKKNKYQKSSLKQKYQGQKSLINQWVQSCSDLLFLLSSA